jgi:Holliday junction resolvasome RuvABC DNA-binding subunit
LELASKVEKLTWVAQLQQISAANRAVAAPTERRLRDDLQSALLNLGYAPNQVKNVLDKILAREEEEELGFEPCLRSALKELSGRPQMEAGRA